MKKALSILCILALSLLSLSHSVLAASYGDVGSRNANFISIEYLTDQGVLEGYADGNYRPYSFVNRAEMMKILVAGRGIEPNKNVYRDCFPDVTTEWFAPYVCYAAAQKWVGGYPDGSFGPERVINRAEAAKMVVGVYAVEEGPSTPNTYSDIRRQDWFYGYVIALSALQASPDGLNFNPGDFVARGEMAELIFRTLVAQGSESGVYTAANSEAFVNEAASTSETSSGWMRKYEVKNAARRNAVCNDGTAAAYYYREGWGNGAEHWQVHLKGGGSCADEASCSDRKTEDPDLVSSKSYPEQINPGGIFSTNSDENPDFYNWNQVYVYYCSSDAWSGDEVREVDGEDFLFNGYAIVKAVIEDLKDGEMFDHPLGEAETLLFTGSSAGGTGLSNNLDRVAKMLPSVDTYGIVDSSWSDGFEPYVEKTYSMSPVQYRNMQYDESCEAVHPQDWWVCGNDLILAEYLETPVLYYVDQVDNNRLKNMGITDRNERSQAQWIKDYVINLHETLPELKAIFSPSKGPHTVLLGDRLFTTRIEGVSFIEAISIWMAHPQNTYRWIVD